MVARRLKFEVGKSSFSKCNQKKDRSFRFRQYTWLGEKKEQSLKCPDSSADSNCSYNT